MAGAGGIFESADDARGELLGMITGRRPCGVLDLACVLHGLLNGNEPPSKNVVESDAHYRTRLTEKLREMTDFDVTLLGTATGARLDWLGDKYGVPRGASHKIEPEHLDLWERTKVLVEAAKASNAILGADQVDASPAALQSLVVELRVLGYDIVKVKDAGRDVGRPEAALGIGVPRRC